MTRAGGRSSGSGPSSSSVSTNAAPQACRSAGEYSRDRGQPLFSRGPHLRRQPPRRRSREHTGDDLDRPQRTPTRREDLRGGRQPRGQHRAIEADPCDGLLGRHRPTPGVGPVEADQIGERLRHRGVPPLGEGATPDQPGQSGDAQPLDLPRHALAERQRRQQIGIPGAGATGRLDRGNDPSEQAVRDNERFRNHAFILLEHMIDFHRLSRYFSSAGSRSWPGERSPRDCERPACASCCGGRSSPSSA